MISAQSLYVVTLTYCFIFFLTVSACCKSMHFLFFFAFFAVFGFSVLSRGDGAEVGAEIVIRPVM